MLARTHSSSTSREKEVFSPSDSSSSSSSIPPSDVSLHPGSAAAAPPSKEPRPLAAVSFHHLCPLAPVCFYLFLTLVRRSMLKSNAASFDATKGQHCISISFSSGASVEGSVKAARCCVKHQRAASLKGINRFLATHWANPACLQPDCRFGCSEDRR